MKPPSQLTLEKLPEDIKEYIHNLERIRADFVANVSHELRTPLTVIHGYLESLIEQNAEEHNPLKKIFSQMYSQTVRMENLIDDLLFLSHLENDDCDQNFETRVNIPELLKTIHQEAQIISGENHHEIDLEVDENLMFLGNEKELRSLFSNIIFNAVKYTPANGEIKISWMKKDNQAIFCVKDTGIGIADEHISRLTERFYRVDPARSRASGGTGLGLAIVKHVLIRHQGILDITSKINLGSTFSCRFPSNRVD